MRITSPRKLTNGFTLVELLVVIVVISVLAALVVLNTAGVEQRKVMQAREIFLLNLKRIQRVADDQAQVLALKISPATDVSPVRYEIMEYIAAPMTQQQITTQEQLWQGSTLFPLQSLPDQVSIRIENLEHDYGMAQNEDLLNVNAPEMMWFGNGEVKPVRLQFYFNQHPIGAELNIDHLGNIHAQ